MTTALGKLEGLKIVLKKARREVEQQKATTTKAKKAQAAKKVAREKD